MKLSVFADHLQEAAAQRGIPLEEVLEKVRSFGISALELSHDSFAKDDFRKKIRDAGFQVSSLHEHYDWGRNTGFGGALLCRAKQMVDAACAAGIASILVIPGMVDEETGRKLQNAPGPECAALLEGDARVCSMREALRELVAYADGRGVRVTLEDFDSVKSPFATLAQIRWFLRTVPGLRCTFDTGNFAFSGGDMREAFAELEPYTVHVHCKDRGPGLSSVSVGGGLLAREIAQTVRTLLRNGYQGFFTIEHYHAADQLRSMEESAAFLQKQTTNLL